jgi:putative CocE/NonD family hydrolase
MPERRPSSSRVVLASLLALAACRPRGDRARCHDEPPAPPPAPVAAASPAPARTTDTEREQAELADLLRERYTKHEHRVPMRDGARLFTTVYVPKDRGRPAPMLLTRTPYSVAPYGEDALPTAQSRWQIQKVAPSVHFLRAGYVLALQDVRGRMMSEGSFVDVRPRAATHTDPKDVDESTDAWDTVDWLVKNVPGTSGRVGVWGISYPGFYAAQAAVDAHPAVKAVAPAAPVTDWLRGDDFHHNGALMLADAVDFFSGFGKPRPAPTTKATWGFDYGGLDLYAFFLRLGPLSNVNERHFHGEIPIWNDMLAHDRLDDWWRARDPLPSYEGARPAVMVVGGFFDAEDLHGTLATYQAFERQSPRGDVSLVMGPWKHGGWARTDGDALGDLSFGAKTSLWYRKEVELAFFERHLRGEARRAPAVEAWCFETGTNEWLAHAAWPPREAKPATLWLRPGHGLAATPAPDGAPPDAYTSDPAHPVPWQARPSGDRGAEYMVADQRFASARPDVLTYVTPPLEADVALAGPVEASLVVSTTGTDADFVVKLVDVHPDGAPDPDPNPRDVKMGGYEQLVRGEVMRGRFRDGLDRPTPFVPGEKARVAFTLPDVSHAFRAGHRVMVQVQSSWFPLVDRNPQTFVDLATAKEADFQPAVHRVHLGGEEGSAITVRVLRGSLPR